jgi:hypothetical protein
VVCDADQIIFSKIDNSDDHKVGYSCGATEDYEINKKYQRPA